MTNEISAARGSASDASGTDSTPVHIAKYTIASSVGAAAVTAIYDAARIRAIPPKEQMQQAATSAETIARISLPRGAAQPQYRLPTGLLAASAALNSGLVTFSFFSLREYVISPVLDYSRKLRILHDETETPLTWSSMRKYHVPDTALTGGLLGGAFNALRRGFPGLLPGALTATLVCTALQLLANEAHIQRIRFVSKHTDSTSSVTSASPSSISSAPATSFASTSTLLDSSLASDQALQAQNQSVLSPPPPRSLGERLLAFVGITRLSDAEYLERLHAQRGMYERRIAELEASVAAETEAKTGAEGEHEEHEKE